MPSIISYSTWLTSITNSFVCMQSCAFVEFFCSSSFCKALAKGYIEINGVDLSINKVLKHTKKYARKRYHEKFY